jgi:hypothetical protein
MHQGDLSAAPEQFVRGLPPIIGTDAGRVDSAISVKVSMLLESSALSCFAYTHFVFAFCFLFEWSHDE